MAAFDFPSSPSVNDVYTANGISYKWDGTVWKRVSATGAQGPTGATGSQGPTGATGSQGQTGAQAYISDSAPSSGITNGDLWWDSDSGDFSIYYNDGNSSEWIEVGSTGPTGPTGAQGSAGSATISNNADNRVITGGSGTNLNGESNLTFDGTKLNIATGGAGFRITRNSQYLELDANTGNGGDQCLSSSAGFRIQTGGVGNSYERARFDTSGRLLIGTSTEGHTSADDLTLATSGNTGITLRSGTSSEGSLFFSDATSGTAEYVGYIIYDHSSNKMSFAAAGDLRMVIRENRIDISGDHSGNGVTNATLRFAILDSNGNDKKAQIISTKVGDINSTLEFGTTVSNSYAERMRIHTDGSIGMGTNDPDQKLHVYESSGSSHCYLHVQNNRSRNAAIKFTTTQGSWLVGQGIGVDADRLMFYDTQQRMGMDSSGNMTLNTGNLVMGTSGKGISFAATSDGSGTDTSEILDDYEEGSWTPTAQLGGSGISVSSATYTKIGRIVHVQFRGYLTGTNGNTVQIGGLPYANWQSYAHQVGPVMHNGFDFAGSEEPYPSSYITGTWSYFQMYYSRTNSNGWYAVTGNDTGGDQFITSLTYFVA